MRSLRVSHGNVGTRSREAGRYGEWRAEGTLPEDRLSPIGFAWLRGKLDSADVSDWTEVLVNRMRAAGRVSS